MSATAAALVKAAILALTDENTRKKIGWVLAAILSPVILLIAFLCALGSGTASHNLSVVELCFYGGKVPSETPDEYRAYIEEMRAGFNLLDGSIENINELTEGEDGLDEIRVKALFNVWLPIISLRREDAARLGYDDAGQWKNLIAGYAMEMAEATLKELNRQTSGDIILKVKKTTVSSIEAKATIGNRPVYDISLWEVKNGKETKLSNLNGKTISIAIPYTPAKNEQTGNLYAVSVDGNGKPQWITKSNYDADQKAVIFELTQPGVYGVGYDAKMPAFTDIENHWAKDNILFVVSRGLLNGTSETTFSPNTGMTRGMFVTALGRLAGVDPADYQSGKFTDVKADAYYAPYVNWAAKTGIVSGTTDTTFAPDTNINREQMAVIMKNYAVKLGYTVPKALEAVTFADNASISSWAKEAVKSMQQAGILAGKTNNRFDPAGTATRAEVATVLRRFVEIVIDPQTANGWQ